MGLTASESGAGDFEMTPEGVFTGRCFKIIDLGTQTTNGQYGTKEQHKVMVSWELIGKDDPRMEDGRPFSVSQFYTVSLHEKAKLRKDLEAWRGRKFTAEELAGFDLGTVIGAYCLIQVVHSEDGKYANVQTIMAYKGDKPEAVNPNVVFDIDNPDMEVFNAFSDNMKAKIMSAPEWKNVTQPIAKSEITKESLDEMFPGDEPIPTDEIPF
jgi:hypothetical protein